MTRLDLSALLPLNSIWKRESISGAGLFAVGAWLFFCFQNTTKGESSLCNVISIGVCVLVVFLVYAIICLINDRLPKAAKDSIGVLFEVEAESDAIYESIKYKLVENFQSYASHENAPSFNAVCVKRKAVERYHKHGADSIVKLLRKTRCIIRVEVRCTVDDVTETEKYALTINYDILAPTIKEEVKRALTEDIRPLGKSVEKLKFSKKETIEYFDFTVQTLVDICQYMLGCVYLLTDNVQEAISSLEQLKKDLEDGKEDDKEIEHLKLLLNYRLFLCYHKLVNSNLRSFEKTKELAYLKAAKGALNEQNQLFPNTYAYCLNRSYISIALDRDLKTAKDCIDMCKAAVKYNYDWTYSDAFLSAYSGEHPMAIKHKYEVAIGHTTEGIVDVIDYIEYMIDQEPSKVELHLAAGFLYEAIGDTKQMKRHFSKFVARYNALDSRTRNYLKGRMNALQCMDQCNNDCLNCG